MSSSILLVDDDATLRMLGSRQCQLLGLTLDVAEGGERAVELANINDYDLILMDLSMPDMSGFEATSRIRENELKSGRKRKPIVAMTAHSDKAHALLAGMDDYIQKPVLITPLADLLSRWIKDFHTETAP